MVHEWYHWTALHCYNSIAVLSFCVLPTILLLCASHTILMPGSGQKAGAASAVSTIPGLPSRKTAKPAFPPLQQSPSLSSPFFLAIVFPLFPLVCSSSPHAARSQDFCLCKSAKTHTEWRKVQNHHSLQLVSTLSSFCPFTKNPLLSLQHSRCVFSSYLIFKTIIIIIIIIIYSDGNLGGNLLL